MSLFVSQTRTAVGYQVRLPVRGLKHRASIAWTRYVLRMPPRSADAYATCVPVLAGLAALIQPKRVLEFGCGNFSTQTFLDRSVFPTLCELHSLENDPSWAERMRDAAGADPRLKLDTVQGPIAAAAEQIDPSKYDLVLIDDSTSLDERVATIRTCAQRPCGEAVFVVHDFEQDAYRRAAEGFRSRYRLAGLNPNSGVLWNGSRLTRSDLRALDRTIRRHRDRLSPADVAGWSAVFRLRISQTT